MEIYSIQKKKQINTSENTNRYNLHTRIAKHPAQAKQEDH
jgi:hypothetical protein